MTLHLKPPLESAEVPLTNGHVHGQGLQTPVECGVTLELDGEDMNEALQ
jgi:hypothetical protein